jgi:hypothetical protein
MLLAKSKTEARFPSRYWQLCAQGSSTRRRSVGGKAQIIGAQ